MNSHNDDYSVLPAPPEDLVVPLKLKGKADLHLIWRELKILFVPMQHSIFFRRIIMIMGTIISILLINAAGEVRMNEWNGAFFGAVEKKDLPLVWHQSGIFVIIMLFLLCLIVSQNWLLERLRIRLRQYLTAQMMDEWMRPARAYRLNMSSEESLNPDQRIQEDVRKFTELTCDLMMGALRATLMLVSFVGVLWGMSKGISFPIAGYNVEIPGYMVWFALLYAGLGSLLVVKVGKPLIDLNDERYTKEANFRYALVRISDNAESISFYAGEKDERRIAQADFKDVVRNMKVTSFANARLTTVALSHGWMVVILPVLVALPGFLQGKLNFGGLMMVVGAFNQVQQSLRWFVESFRGIADWRAVLSRVVTFREALLAMGEYEKNPQTIRLSDHQDKHLSFQDTRVSLLGGEVVISNATAHIRPGERVLLTGESGSGKSTLLRAIGGLWPWGSGQIHLPPENDMMFLPQRPYIPLGTLASAIAYPNTPGVDTDIEKIKQCMTRVNLEGFIPMLHQKARWDKMMSLGQQQRLAFARVLLHKPKWIFLDEATSALDDENQHRMMSLFTEDLPDSAVLSIGHRPGLEVYHTRKLHLIETKTGRVLTRKEILPSEQPAGVIKRMKKVLAARPYPFKKKQ